MKDETNKIVNWIEMGYTRLNYKEELSLVDYIKQLQQENKQLKDNWNKIEQIIENERMSHWTPSPLFLTELLSKMQELEKILKEVE